MMLNNLLVHLITDTYVEAGRIDDVGESDADFSADAKAGLILAIRAECLPNDPLEFPDIAGFVGLKGSGSL